MCGEKHICRFLELLVQGSPPRVRGKECLHHNSHYRARITPACAGKRPVPPAWPPLPRDHPRVCGEKFDNPKNVYCKEGSPPRVRGKGTPPAFPVFTTRITPACAGKSLTIQKMTTRSRDHPRVCGEKGAAFLAFSSYWGSPPRVRGKGRVADYRQGPCGITPACAGKRRGCCYSRQSGWDHPRVCGEKLMPYIVYYEQLGSPPRVRGKAKPPTMSRKQHRITPACAGKRHYLSIGRILPWDHPRVCGEKQRGGLDAAQKLGSPPRVRGKAGLVQIVGRLRGITPACAGKSR